MAALILRIGRHDGTKIGVTQRTTSIGRSRITNIVVAGTTISESTPLSGTGGDGYWIGDLGSRTGTFVNEELAGETRKLRDGTGSSLVGILTHRGFAGSNYG